MKTRHILPLLLPGCIALACGAQVDDKGAGEQGVGSLGAAAANKMDAMLRSLVDRQADVGARKQMPGDLIPTREVTKGGVSHTEVDVLLAADVGALPKIRALGAEVRTVTSSGVMTASIALNKVAELAALPEVTRVEGGKRVRKANDKSQGLVTIGDKTVGLNNPHAVGGAGVVVGVIDTGIDWTHKDFILNSSETGAASGYKTRVRYYWDQSDTANGAPPSDLGLTIGHEYTDANINNALANFDNSWNPATNTFGPLAAGYPIRATARDTDGHGTHVAGSAAGDGSGSGFAGGAPEADLIIVKFDFNGNRNTDANIVDGIRYIFERAKQLGKPAVINMSLGTDFGPHDGSTLEEKGLTDLAGPGKVVVVAAGNPGNNAWSPKLSWGYPLHGESDLTESITVRVDAFPAPTDADGTYVFLDVWYPAGNKCRIKVTSPSGATYPPAGNIRYTNSWITGTGYQEIKTNEGTIGVQNGGDAMGWGHSNADHEAYIEISNNGTKGPAVGTWTIQMVPANGGDTCQGTLHAWYGASNNVIDGWNNEAIPRHAPLLFGGAPTDNRMTIGSPATANGAIAVAAYQSRNSWKYSQGTECLPESLADQQYGVGQLNYYDPFELGELAYFSGRGPRRDSLATPKPEIASPGVGIASSFSHFVRQAEWGKKCEPYFDANGKRSTGYYHYGTNRVLPGDEANILQGTSMATPTATGAIALLMQQKRNLNAACLRTLFSSSARHDAATDTYENAEGGAKTDTDTAAGTGLPNSDWGYGKLDVAGSSSAIAALASCTGAGSCYLDVDCGLNFVCKQSADPCGCGTCEAVPAPPPPPPPPTCAKLTESCESKGCCTGTTCGGKPGKRTCK